MTTKEKIIHSAWELFQASSYSDTTIQDILTRSGVSRSTFYHHFYGKEDLLFSLAHHFDAQYTAWEKNISPSLSPSEKLLSFYDFAMTLVENFKDRKLLETLYGLQVMTTRERLILSPDRHFHTIPFKIILAGQNSGDFSSLHSAQELTQLLSVTLIGLTYSWCLSKNAFSLSRQSRTIVQSLIADFSITP